MQGLLAHAASFTLGFIAGSLPTGHLVSRARGVDIRKHGSGNIGFTNVARTVGLAWAVPVLAVDILKGIVPVLVAPHIGLVAVTAGLGAVLGHIYTPWLGFRGGKGVATAAGVMAVVSPWVLLAGLGGYLLVLATTGYISVSSILTAAALAPLAAVFYPGDRARLIFAAAIGAVIILRHTGNIKRLAYGTEPRFGPWLKLFRRKP